MSGRNYLKVVNPTLLPGLIDNGIVMRCADAAIFSIAFLY